MRASKKYRQHNGQNKKDKWTNTDLQNTTQETKDQETRIPLNTRKVGWRTRMLQKGNQFMLYCSTSDTRRVTIFTQPDI